MKLPLLLSIPLFAACATTPSPSELSPTGEVRNSKVDLYLGARSLNENDWSPVEDQTTVGLEYVHEGLDAPIGFELGLFVSEKSKENVVVGGGTADITGKTGELAAGVHKTFLRDGGRIHPYVGGGLAAIQAKLRADDSAGGSASDDDTSGALYVHGGVEFDLGPAFLIGLDLRLLGGSSVTLFGVNGDADYAQLALVLGARF